MAVVGVEDGVDELPKVSAAVWMEGGRRCGGWRVVVRVRVFPLAWAVSPASYKMAVRMKRARCLAASSPPTTLKNGRAWKKVRGVVTYPPGWLKKHAPMARAMMPQPPPPPASVRSFFKKNNSFVVGLDALVFAADDARGGGVGG